MSGFGHSGYNYGYNKATSSNAQYTLTNPPNDTISCIKFTENDVYIIASSWEGNINVWKKKDNSQDSLIYDHHGKFDEVSSKQAILKFCFGKADNDIFYCTTEGYVRHFNFVDLEMVKDVTTATSAAKYGAKSSTGGGSFGSGGSYSGSFGGGGSYGGSYGAAGSKASYIPRLLHPAPICGIGYAKKSAKLVICTMRGYIAIYDTTKEDKENKAPSTLIGSIELPLNIVGLDLSREKAYIAFANRIIAELNLSGPVKAPTGTTETEPQITVTQIQDIRQNSQITSIAAFPNMDGFITGSVTGDVEIYADAHQLIQVFHRNATDHIIYSANCVAVCPMGLCMSGGGDGQYYFYNNRDAKPFPKPGLSSTTTTKTTYKPQDPITACAINKNAEMCVYATGEDWARGYEEHDSKITKVSIIVKKIQPQEKGIQQAKTGFTTNSSYYNKPK